MGRDTSGGVRGRGAGAMKWWRRKQAPAPAPEQPFTPGMTLAPGERAQLRFMLPPEVAELVEAGGVLTTRESTRYEIVPGRWELVVALLVDGKHVANVKVSWTEGAKS